MGGAARGGWGPVGAAEPPRVAGAWLEAEGTQALMAVLAEGGHRALAVGGCVRDALLGMPVADIDLATDARPERVASLAEAAGFQAVPTGIDHGTVTVVAGGVPHEVTTFRRDVETDGRHAVVAFSDDVAQDAARRDFTMNALYAEADGRLVDPLGGLPDLTARRLRFVGEPEARIREDYLRILRFFRFHARYGQGDPDADGLAACARLADGVDRLSAERVGAEMKRLLAAPDPTASLEAMAGAGVLGRVLPGADPGPLRRLVAAETGRPPTWPRRVVAMAPEADDLPDLWRLSRAEARGLAALAAALSGEETIAETAHQHGPGVALDLALVRAARGRTLPADLDAVLSRAAAARFPLRAADLMPELAGPALGAALRRAEAAWIASDFALDRAALRRIALTS